MTGRSPAFDRLCAAALLLFAREGYDGTSLSALADALGIRKASLYSHVKGKDELYLLLFHEAIAAEEDFAVQCFREAGEGALPGAAFLDALAPRYAASPHLQLLLKAAYFPPALHKDVIIGAFIGFYERLRQMFVADFIRLIKDPEIAADHELYAESWLGIADALCVELLYGSPERTTLRKEAMMMLMSRALR